MAKTDGGPVTIDPLTGVPLLLEGYSDDTLLGSGTGFVIRAGDDHYVVTNWHVVSGRDPSTGQPLSPTGGIPNRLAVWHHLKSKLGTWSERSIALDPSPWLEHPVLGHRADVVAIPLHPDDDVQLYPLDLSLADADMIVSPSEPLSIIGFPFGLSSGGRFPIWKTGHLASDLDLNYNDLPVLLIDATTRSGMSGSPVVARRQGMIRTSKGFTMGTGSTDRFLGVYSGRIHDQADVGMVWKPEVLTEILKA